MISIKTHHDLAQFKSALCGQYWGQDVHRHTGEWSTVVSEDPVVVKDGSYLYLKQLRDITDEEAIYVAKIAHNRYNSEWVIQKRSELMLHLHNEGSCNDVYHVGIILPTCEIIANHHYYESTDPETGFGDEAATFKVNIGKSTSTVNPVPYIAIVDYLRMRGYAMPFRGISVKRQVELGLVRFEVLEPVKRF